MKPSELRQVVFDLAGWRCEWPTCTTRTGLELAHIEHRGMGGSPQRNTVNNTVCLCKFHHDILDGRSTAGRAYEIRALLKAAVRGEPGAV